MIEPPGHDYGAIFGSSIDDVWFAGYQGEMGHWDGRALSPYWSNAAGRILDIWVQSASIAYAIGRDSRGFPLVLKKNGPSWTSLPSPTLFMSYVFDSIVAVGPNDVYFLSNGPVLHYDGSSIRQVSGPYGQLHGGVVVAPGYLWLLGENSAMQRFYMGSWFSPGFDWGGALYGGYASGPTDIWFVGHDGLVIGYNGNQMRSKSIAGGGALRAIQGDGTGHLWVGGEGGLYDLTPSGPGTGDFTFARAAAAPSGIRRMKVFGPSSIWLSGDFGVGYYDGAQFVSPTRHDLPFDVTSLDGTSSTSLFVGGADGILHYRRP